MGNVCCPPEDKANAYKIHAPPNDLRTRLNNPNDKTKTPFYSFNTQMMLNAQPSDTTSADSAVVTRHTKGSDDPVITIRKSVLDPSPQHNSNSENNDPPSTEVSKVSSVTDEDKRTTVTNYLSLDNSKEINLLNELIHKENGHLLLECEKLVATLFAMDDSQLVQENFEKIYEEKKLDNALKIYLTTYVNSDNHRVSKTISEWYVNCSPEQFIRFMNNMDEQKKLDTQMDEFKTVDTLFSNDSQFYSVIYLSYKKMWPVSARDFIYVKHYRKVDENTWCDVSKSIDYQDYPEFKEKVRCEILLSGHRAVLVPSEDPLAKIKRSKIRLFSETNVKTNIPVNVVKMFSTSQMKTYIEKCGKRLKELYE
jgi:hypothetical protein